MWILAYIREPPHNSLWLESLARTKVAGNVIDQRKCVLTDHCIVVDLIILSSVGSWYHSCGKESPSLRCRGTARFYLAVLSRKSKKDPFFWTVVSLIWLNLSLCSLIHCGTQAKQVKQIPALECKTVTAEVSGF